MSESRPTVNLLCLSQEHSRRHCSQAVAMALAKLGWQVHLFVQARPLEAISNSGIPPHCQVVGLAVTAAVEEMAATIEAVQRKAGLIWPLLHTFDPFGAQVGAYAKATWGWRWLHSPDPCRQPTELDADQLIAWRPAPVPLHPADQVSQMRRQHLLNVRDEGWTVVAHPLAILYRQQLALHVGAVPINLPKEITMPLPMAVPGQQSAPTARLA